MNAALPLLALGLVGVAIAAAIGAVAARSLFVMCMHVVAAGVSVAAAVLLLRPGEGGLALAMFAAAWAPVLLLAAMLLSGRATKAAPRRLPWLSVLGVTLVAGALWWPLLELRASAPTAMASDPGALSFWLAPLVFVAAAVAVGMLGYDERGALTRGPDA